MPSDLQDFLKSGRWLCISFVEILHPKIGSNAINPEGMVTRGLHRRHGCTYETVPQKYLSYVLLKNKHFCFLTNILSFHFGNILMHGIPRPFRIMP